MEKSRAINISKLEKLIKMLEATELRNLIMVQSNLRWTHKLILLRRLKRKQ
jgi:hypothetical protein